MSVNIEPRPASIKIFDVLTSCKDVREHFKTWLTSQYNGSITINVFKEYVEVIQVLMMYNYITSLGININVYKNHYDIYFVAYNDRKHEELTKIETLSIVELYQMDYYIERNKKYEGTIMRGLKLATIDTLNWLNTIRWLN